MPATAAIDNETLDHLLSVVNDGPNIEPQRRFGRCTCATPPPGSLDPDNELAYRLIARICFRWTEGGADDVEIVDYHG